MKKQILLDNLEQLETKEYTKLTPTLIPETYEELRSLCIELSTKDNMIYIFSEWNNPNKEFLRVRTLRFYPDGTIRNDYDGENNEPYIIVKDRTPAQMWQIIKNLMEK